MRVRFRVFAAAGAVALSTATSAVAIAAPTAADGTVTDLGVLAGEYTGNAWAIGGSGVIVGQNGYQFRAVRWTG